MSRFIIAGAGHGGLVAARALALAGHTVEVVEQKAEPDLGYDWTDVIEPHICSRNGFGDPPEASFSTAHWNTLLGPSKSAPKRPPMRDCREKHIWRKELVGLLIAGCKDAGVVFHFGTALQGPLMEGNRAVGVRATQNGGAIEFRGDMVIDAAGGLSPIRRNLPESCLVPRELGYGQVFYCWRGFFERRPGEDPQDLFKTYLYHMGRKGISWVIADPEYMDVLIGSMEAPLSESEIARALGDLRADNPLLGEGLLHGGYGATIPVRRPLAVMVADGYAAVGDSAAMADPFGGSGINLAMNMGTLLAKVLLEECCSDGDFSAARLWSYQFRFFTGCPPAEFAEGVGAKRAEKKAETDILKCFMMSLTPAEVDLLFDRNIISVELVFLGGEMGPKDAAKMALRNLDHIGLLMKLAKMLNASEKMKQITRRIPKAYDREAVAEWAGEYEGFGPF